MIKTPELGLKLHLDSQVAGNNRPLYPKVDHYLFKVAHNYEPLALQAGILWEFPENRGHSCGVPLIRNILCLCMGLFWGSLFLEIPI